MIEKKNLNIAIIGAGPLGIAAGRELLKNGFTKFTLFEKERAPGGTWHMHSYPGLACDVWAHSYAFSYALNPDWSANFVYQPEIEAYLQRCATAFGLDPHIRLRTRIVAARLQDDQRWQLETDSGELLLFDVVINAMGNQHTPIFPVLEGRERFRGHSWHSTQWNHEVDLSGKRVVVIGSAASAVQIVPEVAKVAAHLTVLQRTPNWILPRNRKLYGAFAKGLFRYFPAALKALRWGQGKLLSFIHQGTVLDSRQMKTFEKMGRSHIASIIKDPALCAAVTPDSRFGCKRPLVADDYYPALIRDNVTLLPVGAKALSEQGVVTSDGREIPADVVIYCTGYKVMDFERIEVSGQQGASLAEQMTVAPEAYKGIAVPGFPNYFFGMGPNGVLLSVSYFVSAEHNVACIVKLLNEMCDSGVRSVGVKPALHRSYNQWLATRFAQFSWGHSSCMSYYGTAQGQHPFLFPGDFKTFKRQREELSLRDFDVLA